MKLIWSLTVISLTLNAMNTNEELSLNNKTTSQLAYKISTCKKEVSLKGPSLFLDYDYIKKGVISPQSSHSIIPPTDPAFKDDIPEWGNTIILKISRSSNKTKLEQTEWQQKVPKKKQSHGDVTEFILKKSSHYSIHLDEKDDLYLIDNKTTARVDIFPSMKLQE